MTDVILKKMEMQFEVLVLSDINQIAFKKDCSGLEGVKKKLLR